MKNIVKNTIKKHNLIKKNDKVLIALSGGSDSVCLLHILNDLKASMGFEIFACHLNHSIREEADNDCRFAGELCKKLGITFFARKTDIKKTARENKISEELAGRNERYAFFEEISREYGINLIATAHNKNDVAETVLMHIIRGCGIDGLKGIAYKRGKIIRPLLDAEKKDIEAYCVKNGYKFVVDKTNNQDIYTRNKIRLDLIPAICRDFNPAFTDTIVKNAENIRDDAEFLNDEALKCYNAVSNGEKVSVLKLKSLPKAMIKRVILIMHEKYFGDNKNMQSCHVESILGLIENGKSGKSVNIDNNTKCVCESGWIYLKPNYEATEEYEYSLNLDEKVHIKECGISVTLKKWTGTGDRFRFDENDVIFVRNRRRGDVFYPVGMTGKKKLSDYFTDEKIPLSERNKIPIIMCNENIVYIAGRRKDRRFADKDGAYTFLIE